MKLDTQDIKHTDGMTVPEGYFADFATRMMAQLPEREEPKVLPRTWWQRVRPYAYLAAMFAGIWCMLQIFALMGDAGAPNPLTDNPVLAEALKSDTFLYDDYGVTVDEYDLYDELYNSGFSPSQMM